jgi:hypothetical protein
MSHSAFRLAKNGVGCYAAAWTRALGIVDDPKTGVKLDTRFEESDKPAGKPMKVMVSA